MTSGTFHIPPGLAEDDEPSIPSIWDGDDVSPVAAVPVGPDPGLLPAADLAAPRAWREAEAALAVRLAEAAGALARVDERLLAWTPAERRAAAERLAMAQAVALLWAEGATVGIERLGLDAIERVGRTDQEDHEIARAQWAARRLLTGDATPEPLREAWDAVERDGAWSDAWGDGGLGAVAPLDWSSALREWEAALAALDGAHPLTVAAAAETVWRALGLSEPGTRLAPALPAMVLAAQGCRGGLAFAPMPRRRQMVPADPTRRLAAWLADVRDGSDEALAVLERLQEWRGRAATATADLSGRTPPRLLSLLAARYAVTAMDAARAAGVSVSAAQRNLVLLTERGLAREITRQARYRVWTAAI